MGVHKVMGVNKIMGVHKVMVDHKDMVAHRTMVNMVMIMATTWAVTSTVINMLMIWVDKTTWAANKNTWVVSQITWVLVWAVKVWAVKVWVEFILLVKYILNLTNLQLMIILGMEDILKKVATLEFYKYKFYDLISLVNLM